MNGIIQLTNVGKRYLLEYRDRLSFKESFLNLIKMVPRQKEFWALKEINLDVPKGQTLGIIGRNASGKTTLLKLLCGVTKPTAGSLKIDGRVTGLLELGTGFQDDLTGRENIYLNGSILGLSRKELQRNIDSIISFADIGEFIDAPMRTYSAGMYLRLGFSIAVNIDFDILLIDELLSVGDIVFQDKCIEKLKNFRKIGKTIIIVSQSLPLLEELTDRAVLLNGGLIEFQGRPKDAISQYMGMASVKEERDLQMTDDVNALWGMKVGTGEVEIERVRLFNSIDEEQTVFETNQRLKILVDFFVHNEIEDPHFGVAIFREDKTYCHGPNTRFAGIEVPKLKRGRGWFSIEYQELNLLPGNYKISVAIWEREEKFAYAYHHAIYDLKICSSKKDHGIVYLRHRWDWKSPD